MTDYDSDSSEGEFTETNVLLGYASKEAEEDTISKLGGLPEWIVSDKAPSAALARCKTCKDIMVLLLQLNGELPEKFPTHERRLYVFACKKATCRRKAGTVRAIRGVRVWKDESDSNTQKTKEVEKPAEPEERKPQESRLGETLFGATSFGGGGGASIENPFSSKANPFSSSSLSNVMGNANPLSSQPAKPAASKEASAATTTTSTTTLSKTFAEMLAINNNTPPHGPPHPPERWPETPQQAPYPTLYLADADYETLDNTTMKMPTDVPMVDAEAPEPSALDREAFESSMDAAFQKFADRLAQNPDQVIRYEFSGTPLLYSKTDSVGELLTKRTMPDCSNCNGPRTFEVQLTPNAIAELEADDLSLDGMEWGTIVVGVCERDCVPRGVEVGEAGYLEEWAGVQWEELAKNK